MCICILFGIFLVVPLLNNVHDKFMEDVDARSIASDAHHKGIIAVEHESMIKNAKSKKEANDVLFTHLLDQATLSSLKKLCSIMINTEGYARMNEFGHMLQKEVSIIGYWTQFAV